MNDVKKNFIYNVAYQILKIIMPLITLPYISRIIGADGIGQYSFTYSIVCYFMMFALLGVQKYGNRTIAKTRDNKEEMSKKFKEIYFFQFVMSTIMCVLYLLYVVFFDIEYKTIAYIQIIYVISCAFDINWFFFGMERFKLTVTRNVLIKILALILILIFVKNKDDVWIYTLIMAGCTLLSQLLLLPFLKKSITKTKLEISNVKQHLKPCLKLFLPVIAVTIYKVMDKTMIGWLSGVTELGFYENAEKIISTPIILVDALGTVMLPRMTNLYNKGENKNANNIIEKSLKFIMFLAYPIVFGLIAIAIPFSVVFFGESFEKTGIILSLLSITIPCLAFGNVIRTQYLIPKEKDKEYIISAFLGAFVNFTLNALLIPTLYSVGACIGTIMAELIVVLYQCISVRKEIPVGKYFRESLPFLIKASIMFVCTYSITFLNLNFILDIILKVLIGILTYVFLNLGYISSLIHLKKIHSKKNTNL